MEMFRRPSPVCEPTAIVAICTQPRHRAVGLTRAVGLVGWCVLAACLLGPVDAVSLYADAPAVQTELAPSRLTPAAAAHLQPLQSSADILAAGLKLEQDAQWGEAVRHYEAATRAFPRDQTLYQRLLISRLHYDVNRRFEDQSYLVSLREMTTSQALDLYSEVLANLQANYVDEIDWSRIQLHGTAALEVALTEDVFLDSVLASADRQRVEAFRLRVHRELAGRSTQSRFDLRSNVSFVAELAHREIGLAGVATVLEYVSGSVSTLDTYTRLLSGSQLDETNSNIEGNFVGLGVELKAGVGVLNILSVIPGGPAAGSGIRAGETITRVAGVSTRDQNPDVVADLLRGPENTTVAITVLGIDGTTRDLNITRRRVDVPSVENVHLADAANRIGYFRLTNFQKTTPVEVERALWDLRRQNMQSLVIDLRGNPGGLLSAAIEIADRFLADGRIVTTRGRNPKENFEFTAHRTNTWNVPLVVLIDGDSASASEVLAGALSDRGRATIVGQTSYGKGSVQGVFPLRSAKFGLCLTTAKFYSPSGRTISDNGVQPHVEVAPTYIAARPTEDGKVATDLDDAALQQGIAQLVAVPRDLISQRN